MKVITNALKPRAPAIAQAGAGAKFDRQSQHLLQNLDLAHAAYYQAETFGGPSLYFHQKAIEAAATLDVGRFAECTYATLASWGMHRMGQGGSKMCDFATFYDSLKTVWPLVVLFREKQPANLAADDWRGLKSLFIGIKCMRTATTLVGNSKVMAHALPNLVPPVDREYTLKFLYGRGGIKNDIEVEWRKLEEILRGFFYPVSASVPFREAARSWLQQRHHFVWDTSELKVIDNLVIGLMKMSRSVTVDKKSRNAEPAQE
jgi:hypothetical protein